MAGRERKPKQNKSVSSPLLSSSASAWSQSQGVNSNVILHDTHTKKEIKLQQQTVHDHTFDNINKYLFLTLAQGHIFLGKFRVD